MRKGIRNVLLVTGDPIPSAERDEVKSVYQFNSRKLAAFAASLGKQVLPGSFHLFGALNVNARNFDVQLKLAKEKEGKGGIQNVVWVAAGGSNGGNYPAQYFMDREAKSIRSQMFTSNEFVYAPPKFVGENTIAVITSMRGTPETCVAAQVAKDLGAVTIGLYVQESLLTETCEYNIKYDSIMFDESDQSKTNAALGMRIPWIS